MTPLPLHRLVERVSAKLPRRARRSQGGWLRKKSRSLLELLQLENRLAPATVLWDGGPTGTGTNWNDSANWDGDILPGVADDAMIGSAFAGVTVTSSGSVTINSVTSAAALRITAGTFSLAAASSVAGLTLNAGTLTVNGPTSANNFLMDGGTLTGPGTLTLTGTAAWLGGTMGGAGVTAVAATGSLAISSSLSKTLDGRPLSNAGAVTLSASLQLANGAAISNLAGALFEAQDGAALSFPGGGAAPAFNNAGAFRVSAGGPATLAGVPFNNSGAVQVLSGTLDLRGGGASYGRFDVALGATLSFATTQHDLSRATLAGVGTLSFGSIGTPAAPQLLEVPSQDRGDTPAGFGGPFTVGSLALSSNAYVRLVDAADTSPGPGVEALYVNNLLVPVGSTLDLNLLHLYARSAQINGTIVGGTINPTGLLQS